MEINPGTILIADPFLKDVNFVRSVIFMCEHNAEDGSLGFVINHKLNKTLGELVPDMDGCTFPVYYGGPVQMNTVHFLHRCPNLFPDGIEVTDGIFWGADFAHASELIKEHKIKEHQIRFYIGYSGWGIEQLAEEIKEKTWLLTHGNKKLVFHNATELIWRDAIKQLGTAYEEIIHYPLDPQLN